MAHAAAQRLMGIGAAPGMVEGRAFMLDRARAVVVRRRLEGPAEVGAEVERLRAALQLSDRQLVEIKGKVHDGGEHALILEAHRLMLQDPLFAEAAEGIIAQEYVNAEWAVRKVVRKLRAEFEKMDDAYFRERRADIGFVGERVVRNLLGHAADLDPEREEMPPQSIVVAHDLSPADAALLLRKGVVVGFVTDVGGHTSHVSIVARARAIPCVVGVGRASEAIERGDLLLVDGRAGSVTVNPTGVQVEQFRRAAQRQVEAERALHVLRDLPTVTTDQVKVSLLANMEFAEQVPAILEHGAEGIGLYRTEFLYLEREDLPTEEEHYQAYRAVLEAMGERPVTIRTLDMGADKLPRQVAARRREREPNPAMGLRAIRYCLKQRELFMAQLRGLLRASVHGNLKIMFPMISGLSELREAKGMLLRAQEELTREGIPFAARTPIGIMVETPAAAWAADKLAQECDFFSVGTNDLIQYSLAIDRQNREVAYLYRPLHIAVLRSVRFVVEAAHSAGIGVSMCGEMAGEPSFALLLIGMGLDALSMEPGQIPLVKRLLRSATAEEGRQLLERAVRHNTAEEIDRFVRAQMEARFGELLE